MQRTKGFYELICIVLEVGVKTIRNVCPNGGDPGCLTEIVREVACLSLKRKDFLLKKDTIVTKKSIRNGIDEIFDRQ